MSRLPAWNKEPKKTITLRLDSDVIAWLRKQKRYNTRLNIWLRKLMERRARRRIK